MEKKKDVKRIYTGIALVLWVVVSLIGTFFYKEFGGALGDSRIFLWLYAPVLLLATRFGEFRPEKSIGRWGQVFVTFAIGAAVYIGLLLRCMGLGQYHHSAVRLYRENSRTGVHAASA